MIEHDHDQLRQLHLELNIPDDYARSCLLPRQHLPDSLCDAGVDIFDRPQKMTPATLRQWNTMQNAAGDDRVLLQLVSAYRSVDYQCELIRNKLRRGLLIEDILKVNAAPGYSEHHTGRALDLTTPGLEPLTLEFDRTDAFFWLHEHAGEYGFSLSFPEGNPFGIDYEPWHWTWHG